jgi:hypothetical protein
VSNPTFDKAQEHLTAKLQPATVELLALAEAVGCTSPAHTPTLLALAQIEDVIASVSGHKPPAPRTNAQLRLLQDLGVRGAEEHTRRTADALIQLAIARERLAALQTLRPQRGDRLFRKDTGEIVTVTSIDATGSVWVKGAAGHPTLPQTLARSRS